MDISRWLHPVQLVFYLARLGQMLGVRRWLPRLTRFSWRLVHSRMAVFWLVAAAGLIAPWWWVLQGG
ncbi:hypothetical protein [Halorhodospira neutriphila]|uniref:Uncharacterized protein n=1 Tax=Halorhodospira neutriphila TaxID=168379 RepID=A0ABS1E5E1_9GAMM|nr:hypothetical protein [Halorhodospira neutriphila]MBK1726725.1 hypothetical protein [Halorhodospira neutriphila]